MWKDVGHCFFQLLQSCERGGTGIPGVMRDAAKQIVPFTGLWCRC